MSFSGTRRKERDIKKAQYYVWYLGWKEVRGLWGREFTEPITKELVQRRAHEPLPKLTIEVNRKEVKVVQLVEKKKGKVEKVKYPPIPGKDVTYAVQALSPDMDVVSCIYLGYNPQTHCAVHVHVYRCDSPETAEIFSDHLTQLTDLPENQKRIFRIEADLVAKNQIVPRPSAYVGAAASEANSTIASSMMMDDGDGRGGLFDDRDGTRHANYDSGFDIGLRVEERRDQPDFHRLSPHPDVQQEKDVVDIYDSVTNELKAKLRDVSAAPMLLPPKDYDTLHRSAGNLQTAEEIRRHHLSEDSARGESERGSRESRGLSSEGSRHSQGFAREPESPDMAEDAELRAVTPRWKMTSQTYHPPSSPRAQSPMLDIYDNVKPRARPGSTGDRSSGSGHISPGYHSPDATTPPSPLAKPIYNQNSSPIYSSGHVSPGYSKKPSNFGRPMSPPPELKKSTYFPSNGSSALPGYLTSPPHSPSLQHRTRSSMDGSDGSGGGGVAGGSKKYTASNLGLTGVADKPRPVSQQRLRQRDEGYRSMDRGDPVVQSAYFYDEAYSGAPGFRVSSNDHIYQQPRAPPGFISSMPSLVPPRRGFSERRPMPNAIQEGAAYAHRNSPY